MFVISHETVPEPHRDGYEVEATIGSVGGFILIIVTSVAFAEAGPRASAGAPPSLLVCVQLPPRRGETMIKGIHAMFYSSHADELREFLRDKLALPFNDVGRGWLIFDVAEGDIGCHPTDGSPPSGTHDISFYCDDIEATVAELRGRGVRFADKISDQGWGRVCHFVMPGGVEVMLYQPLYGKRRASASARKDGPSPTRDAKRAPPAARNRVKRPRGG